MIVKLNVNVMKTLLIIFGLFTAGGVLFISSTQRLADKEPPENVGSTVFPAFNWKQVAPPGAGTHQYEWKPGTYPSALRPIVAFNNDLWMIGQKRSWSSKDGIKWQAYDKNDWGERISMSHVFFNNRYWVSGGLDYQSSTFLNEVWSSADGKNWERTVEHADWSPRKGHTLVEYQNKLWLFGGAIGVDGGKVSNRYINDIWSSTDGIHWTKVVDNAPWTAREEPRVLVFKNALWLVGGQGHSDIWRSEDGENWEQLKKESPWKDRFDYGAEVFKNILWIYGGREHNSRNAYKDVWFSITGTDWQRQTDRAPWTARSGSNSVAFRDKLLLYGGKHTGHADSFSGDIWEMSGKR
jgi:hypothetical protein